MTFSADLEAVTKGERQNALHYAARYGSVDCLKILIENGSRIDSLDFMERTPMQVAAEIGKITLHWLTLYIRCWIVICRLKCTWKSDVRSNMPNETIWFRCFQW